MPANLAGDGWGDTDTEEEEEEELEEDGDLDGSEGSGEDTLALSRTNKQDNILNMLRDEEGDTDDDFADFYPAAAKDTEHTADSRAMLPGTHVRVGSEELVQESLEMLGGHWQSIIGPCCKKVGMVVRHMENPGLVFVKFNIGRKVGSSTAGGAWDGWGLSSASFTLPKRALEVVFPPTNKSRSSSRKLSLSDYGRPADLHGASSSRGSFRNAHASASLPAHLFESYANGIGPELMSGLQQLNTDHLEVPANASFSSIASIASITSSLSDRSPPKSPSGRTRSWHGAVRVANGTGDSTPREHGVVTVDLPPADDAGAIVISQQQQLVLQLQQLQQQQERVASQQTPRERAGEGTCTESSHSDPEEARRQVAERGATASGSTQQATAPEACNHGTTASRLRASSSGPQYEGPAAQKESLPPRPPNGLCQTEASNGTP